MTPKFNTFDLSKLVRQFCSVRRFSTIFTVKDEGIAEHSTVVALLSSVIYQTLPDEFKSDIDIKQVCYCCIFHDSEEIVTGDIPRCTKHHSEKMTLACNDVKDYAINYLKSIFGDIFELTNYENHLSNLEKSYLKCMDFYSVILKAYWEVTLGNTDFLDILPELHSYCKELCKSKIGDYIYSEFMKPVITELSKVPHKSLNFRLR